jgi:hypothetical protein
MTTRLSTEATKTLGTPTTAVPRPSIRADFKQELERKLEGWLGLPGTPQRAKVESLVEGMLTEPDAQGVRHFNLDNLSKEKQFELQKLQKACEDFETVFVKGLLSQMRRTSFAEETGPMGQMAKDFLDQEVAASVSRSRNTIGIAKTVFIDMAQRAVSTIDLTQGKETTTNGKED